MIKGQLEVDLAKVRTYHETGRLIHEHVLLFRERADYGAKTVQRLANDIHVHRSVLQRCVQLARAIPNCATWRNLTWAHYRVLIPIADDRQRKALASAADQAGWTVVQLAQRIRALAPPDEAASSVSGDAAVAPKPLTPKRGTVGVCRVTADGDALSVDLGFTCYADLPALTRLKEGDLVRLDADGAFSVAPDATKADLYTYRAEILRVVDGDTMWVKVHLRPDLWIKEKLRLRGLDCPELATPEGQAAKRFVEGLMAQAKGITITTTKPDKWDRYLSDVFLAVPSDLSAKASATAEASAKEGAGSDGEMFLNNHLLAHGHARRMDEYALTDWDGTV